jgi:hypothetical protein
MRALCIGYIATFLLEANSFQHNFFVKFQSLVPLRTRGLPTGGGINSISTSKFTSDHRLLANGDAECGEGNALSSDAEQIIDGRLNALEPLCDPAGSLTDEELSDENLVKIVNLVVSDQDCNILVWKALGYVLEDPEGGPVGPRGKPLGLWNSDKVFPKWRAQFPQVEGHFYTTILIHKVYFLVPFCSLCSLCSRLCFKTPNRHFLIHCTLRLAPRPGGNHTCIRPRNRQTGTWCFNDADAIHTERL